MGGGRGEWGKGSLGVGVHGGLFVFATFDETALVLEPVGDAGESRGQGNARRRERSG